MQQPPSHAAVIFSTFSLSLIVHNQTTDEFIMSETHSSQFTSWHDRVCPSSCPQMLLWPINLLQMQRQRLSKLMPSLMGGWGWTMDQMRPRKSKMLFLTAKQ
eukprot:295211_1